MGFDPLLDLGDRRGQGLQEARFAFDLAQVAIAAQRARATQQKDLVEVDFKLFCRGRYQDNILVKRLWWTVKYQDLYLQAFEGGADLGRELKSWFEFYNSERPHQAHGGRTKCWPPVRRSRAASPSPRGRTPGQVYGEPLRIKEAA